MTQGKPKLNKRLSGEEFLRWYYLKSDLQRFAKNIGLSSSGSKEELKERIAAKLDGRDLPPTVSKETKIDRLPTVLSLETVIYPGQKLTARLRKFMIQECGPDFIFDQHMRSFFADGEKKTLKEAIKHWHKSRSWPKGEVGKQFEYNRFMKSWYNKNPSGSHEELLQTWKEYKENPH